MKHSTYLRLTWMMALVPAAIALFSTDLAAKTEEPTLSIPKATPFKPVCVGWSEKQGCVATISEALKNVKENGTIYVRAGSGIADNLTISKGVTICAASGKDTCQQDPSAKTNFRLIRMDETTPCIRLNFTPRPGKVIFRGMEIRDIADPVKPCIVNTRLNAGSSRVIFDNSLLEDVGLQLSDLAAVTVTNTAISYTYAGAIPPTWILKNVSHVAIQAGTVYGGVDLTLENSSASLSNATFDTASLIITGTGSSSVTGNTFRRAGLTISGSAIRSVEDNRFYDSMIFLDHEGLVTFENNLVDSDPFRKADEGEAALLIANGVNRISQNHFGSACSGLPSEPDSTCECTEMPAFQFVPTAAETRTTRVRGNRVCTNDPAWIGGDIGPDETVRGNCAVTRDRKVHSASSKYYRGSKHPPASELIVRLLRPGENASCQ